MGYGSLRRSHTMATRKGADRHGEVRPKRPVAARARPGITRGAAERRGKVESWKASLQSCTASRNRQNEIAGSYSRT